MARLYFRGPMMDPKLTVLFVLIACVIGMSHLTEENLGRMRRQLVDRSWREFVPSRRRV
jgi:hypothetical protein